MIDGGFQQHEKLRFLYVLDMPHNSSQLFIQYFTIMELVGNYIYMITYLAS